MRDYNALLTPEANTRVRNNIYKKFILTQKVADIYFVSIRTHRGGVIGRSPNLQEARKIAIKRWFDEMLTLLPKTVN